MLMNRNKMWNGTPGEYVCFIDDDDMLHKKKKPSLFRRFVKWLDVTFNSPEYRYWRDNQD